MTYKSVMTLIAATISTNAHPPESSLPRRLAETYATASRNGFLCATSSSPGFIA